MRIPAHAQGPYVRDDRRRFPCAKTSQSISIVESHDADLCMPSASEILAQLSGMLAGIRFPRGSDVGVRWPRRRRRHPHLPRMSIGPCVHIGGVKAFHNKKHLFCESNLPTRPHEYIPCMHHLCTVILWDVFRLGGVDSSNTHNWGERPRVHTNTTHIYKKNTRRFFVYTTTTSGIHKRRTQWNKTNNKTDINNHLKGYRHTMLVSIHTLHNRQQAPRRQQPRPQKPSSNKATRCSG